METTVLFSCISTNSSLLLCFCNNWNNHQPINVTFFNYQTSTSRSSGLQHMCHELKWSQSVRWPPKPFNECRTPAKYYSVRGYWCCLCKENWWEGRRESKRLHKQGMEKIILIFPKILCKGFCKVLRVWAMHAQTLNDGLLHEDDCCCGLNFGKIFFDLFLWPNVYNLFCKKRNQFP